jgi:predicted nucleotidyltransferase component of viral defense system
MPRLSVDIDLTYLPVLSRQESLAAIEAAMTRIGKAVEKDVQNAKVTYSKRAADEIVTRLIVQTYDAQIKIEVTPVLRGCVYAAEPRPVSPEVERQFGFAEMPVVSFADLYAGKIMAALDRQHPRDLFDIRDLLAKEGISDELRHAFIVYLISHHRPMHEVLLSAQKNIAEKYENEFAGMTAEPVPLDDLIAARASLVEAIIRAMPAQHRAFLIGFESGDPDWTLLSLPDEADAEPLVLVVKKSTNISSASSGDMSAPMSATASTYPNSKHSFAAGLPKARPAGSTKGRNPNEWKAHPRPQRRSALAVLASVSVCFAGEPSKAAGANEPNTSGSVQADTQGNPLPLAQQQLSGAPRCKPRTDKAGRG